MKQNKIRVYSLCISEELYQKLRQEAFIRNVSKAKIINEILAKRYENEV